MSDRSSETRLSTADIAAGQRRQVEPAPDPGMAAPNMPNEQASAGGPRPVDGAAMALFNTEEAGSFRSRWALIQASFVDEPRSAVEQGDALVAELMQRLAEVFSTERARLEGQWSTGSDVSTEDLRLALRRYRSFFDRLLSL
jgi:hypothetical protein